MNSNIDELIKKLASSSQEGCITMTLGGFFYFNLDRAQSELKRLLIVAETELRAKYSSSFSKILSTRLKALVKKVDFNRSQQSLILFVNLDISEYIWMPISLKSSVVIGDFFSTKELLRSTQLLHQYYILLLDLDKARVFKAWNQYAFKEVYEGFPIKNQSLFVDSIGMDDLCFVHNVDRGLSKLLEQEPNEVYLAIDRFYLDYFLRFTTNKRYVVGYTEQLGKLLNEKEIMARAWAVVASKVKQEETEAAIKLLQEYSKKKVLKTLYDIYKNVLEGKGHTLLVQWNYFQPAIVYDEEVFPVEGPLKSLEGFCNEDIIMEIIAKHKAIGGEVIFFEKGEHPKLKNLMLIVK